MEEQIGHDRRHLQRFAVKALAMLRTVSADQAQSYNLTTRDISSGGAFFLMAVPLEVGEKVNVTIFLTIAALEGVTEEGAQTRIVTDGEVVRREEVGVAVQFSGHYTIAPAST